MKEYFKKNKFDLIIFVFFVIFIVVSYITGYKSGIDITKNFLGFIFEMLTIIPAMFILIGLFDVWVPKEKIQKHIGNEGGIMGSVWVILLAMLQAGPLYGAFPVTYILWKKGASIRNIFIYLGAFSTMKIPMLFFEISFLGLKFSILRTLISLPVFIVIAFIMEWIFKNKNFKINEMKKDK
ncbi:MAG TPA: permease [Spirochaetota bacterium]|nr:permease [Spirochaetota bacterium]